MHVRLSSLFLSAQFCQCLQDFSLKNCRQLTDRDFEVFLSANMPSLTSLSVSGCDKVTDKGVAVLATALGSRIRILDFSNCTQLTDFAAVIIGNLCTGLRSLELTNCTQLTDDTVHTVSAAHASTAYCTQSHELISIDRTCHIDYLGG